MSSSKLNLDRKTLAQFLPNNQAIRAFEQVLEDVGATLPSLIENASNDAASATAAALQALAMIHEIASGLTELLAAPARMPDAEAEDFAPPAREHDSEADDFSPRNQIGTLAPQNDDEVDITGGRIGLDAGTEGAPAFYLSGEDTTGFYRIGADNWGWSASGTKVFDWSATGMSITQQITSTLATGTAPLVIASTTKVPNLHVERATSADEMTAPAQFVDPGAAVDPATTMALANALRTVTLSRKL